MIAFNPCGYAVDYTRRAYSTDCRFFRDADLVSRVRWMECQPDALALPFPSVILSRQQENDDWLLIEPGEVAEAPRTTTLEMAPPGSGVGHICGTEEDFAQGAHYDPEREPVRYGAYGLPLCCFPAKRVRGGAGGPGVYLHLIVHRGYTYGGSAGSGRPAFQQEPGFVLRSFAAPGGYPVFTSKRGIRVYGGAAGSGRPRVNDLTEWLRTVHGVYTFTATATRDHIIECWGAGAGGQIGTDPASLQGGGGGGGGAYVRSVVHLTAGVDYEVHVAEGGHPVHSGAGTTNPPTTFDGGVVFAESGATANPPNAGPGGSTAGSIGQVKFRGGNGAATVGVTNGGGGGASAGPLNAGLDAIGITGGPSSLFPSARGGDGQFTMNPVDGAAPGAGGGGKAVASITEHGAGADGQVLISWNEIV